MDLLEIMADYGKQFLTTLLRPSYVDEDFIILQVCSDQGLILLEFQNYSRAPSVLVCTQFRSGAPSRSQGRIAQYSSSPSERDSIR